MSTLSLAMCTFNGEAYLAEQLRSIAGQSRRPDEMIICDDGSTDGTERIVHDFASTSGLNVQWHAAEKQRLGPAGNFERAIRLCRGDMIALSDQDDVWRPDKLALLCGVLSDDPSVGLVFSDMRLMDVSSQPLGRTQWQALGFGYRQRRAFAQGGAFDVLLRFNVVNGAALMFRSSLRDAVLPIPHGWMHDEWIALIGSVITGVRPIDDTLVDYRVHSSQQVGPAVSGIAGQIAYARRQMGREYFVGMLDRTRSAQARIDSLADRLIRKDAQRLMAERVEHYRKRAELRRPGLLSLPMILSECVHGRYRRFGYGWKGVLQDLLLR